jgi:hypothetical protein
MPYKGPEKQREADRRWRAANLEKAREANRKWREANPEKAREANRRWREANPEKGREQSRRWREANLEKARARAAAYRAANCDARRTYMAANKASQRRLDACTPGRRPSVQTPEGPGARFSRSCPRPGDPSPHRATMNGRRGSGMRTEDAYPNPLSTHRSIANYLLSEQFRSPPARPRVALGGARNSSPVRH